MTVDAKRLRHVGLSAKAAALLTKPVASDMVWGPVQSAQDGDYRMEYVLGPERLYLANAPMLANEYTPLSDTLEYARGWVPTSFDPLTNGFFGSSNGDTVVRPVLLADNFVGEVASGDPHPAFVEALKAYPSPNFPPHDNELPPPSTRDLLRAGLSPRQAKTWLKVLGMEATGPQLTWVDQAGVDVGYGKAAYAGTITPSSGTILAPTARAYTEADFYIFPQGAATPEVVSGPALFTDYWGDAYVDQSRVNDATWDGFAGVTWDLVLYIWDTSPLPAVPVWSGGFPDHFVPARLALDPRLKALIHGGFTTAQARLLLELL